jgi:hypothetical protein
MISIPGLARWKPADEPRDQAAHHGHGHETDFDLTNAVRGE